MGRMVREYGQVMGQIFISVLVSVSANSTSMALSDFDFGLQHFNLRRLSQGSSRHMHLPFAAECVALALYL